MVPDEDPDEAQAQKRAQVKKAIQKAEEKFRMYLDQRDLSNQEARAIADERDSLNAKKKEKLGELDGFTKDRDELVTQVREHKSRRNALQDRAKELIFLKRKMLKEKGTDPINDAEALEKKINELDYKQQTSTISLKEENKIIAEIRQLARKHRQILTKVEAHKEVKIELDKVDDEIDVLFKQADEEHKKVMDISAKIDKIIKSRDAMVHEIASIAAEANKKHQKFLKAREKANEFHAKAQEMKGKVVSVKRERMEERRAERAVIQEYNKEAKDKLKSSSKEDYTEKALEKLKKGGKITIG
jgi:uncharacterized coiled-coil DUF342 family protein